MRGKGIKEEEQTIALLENRQTDRQTVEQNQGQERESQNRVEAVHVTIRTVTSLSRYTTTTENRN